jgi:hypothetical protein
MILDGRLRALLLGAIVLKMWLCDRCQVPAKVFQKQNERKGGERKVENNKAFR